MNVEMSKVKRRILIKPISWNVSWSKSQVRFTIFTKQEGLFTCSFVFRKRPILQKVFRITLKQHSVFRAKTTKRKPISRFNFHTFLCQITAPFLFCGSDHRTVSQTRQECSAQKKKLVSTVFTAPWSLCTVLLVCRYTVQYCICTSYGLGSVMGEKRSADDAGQEGMGWEKGMVRIGEGKII
jgi:hypothetical protein